MVTQEHLVALREEHNPIHEEYRQKIQVYDVVILKVGEKNKGKWKIAVVDELFYGEDDVVRSVHLRTRKNNLEQPIQLN